MDREFQSDHCNTALGNLFGNLGQYVEAFLLGKSRDDADDRARLRHIVQAKGVQQIRPAGALAFKIFRREMRRKMAVRGRIPKRIVHAVQDAAQVSGALLKNPLQLLAELGGLNLLGIFLANGCRQIGIHHSALQEIKAVIMFQLVHGEYIPGKQQFFCRAGREQTLKCGVMDGKHRGRTEQIWVVYVGRRAQVNRNQRGLPIVDMKDVRHAELFCGFDNRAAKQAKSFCMSEYSVPLGP